MKLNLLIAQIVPMNRREARLVVIWMLVMTIASTLISLYLGC